MLLLDPDLPVLTEIGYIPAKLLNPEIKLVSGTLQHVNVKSVEFISANLRYVDLKWKSGGFEFRFPECVYILIDDPCKFCPPEILSLEEYLLLKFGVDPSLFVVPAFDNIESVFLDLLKLPLNSLKKLQREDRHSAIALDSRLLYAQTFPLKERSKFLRGLLSLNIARRKKLIAKLPEVASEYSGNLKFILLPQIYDVYNFREFCACASFLPGIVAWNKGKCGILFKEEMADQDISLRVKVSKAKIQHNPQDWVSIDYCSEEEGIIAAGLHIRAAV